eukprot:scaffold16561_cov117-Cyclotella_meneghiniana.AAC.2
MDRRWSQGPSSVSVVLWTVDVPMDRRRSQGRYALCVVRVDVPMDRRRSQGPSSVLRPCRRSIGPSTFPRTVDTDDAQSISSLRPSTVHRNVDGP